MQRWEKKIIHQGREITLEFIRRPFREGLEVRVDYEGEIISLAELGLGQAALEEKMLVEIDRYSARRQVI